MTNVVTVKPSRRRPRWWLRLFAVALTLWLVIDAVVSIGAQRSPTDVAVIVARQLASLHVSGTDGTSAVADASSADQARYVRDRLQMPIGRLLVLREASSAGRPVVVSVTTFADRPRPAAWNLWLAAPKHLACYEDGTIEFWTESSFERLDLGAYTDAEQWLRELSSR